MVRNSSAGMAMLKANSVIPLCAASDSRPDSAAA
jgi:hypothetical protein